jgi:hypothetical protein
MGVPPAKLHEKPAEANKSGTGSEQMAGFFDPVARVFSPQTFMKYSTPGVERSVAALVAPAVYAAGSLDVG